MNEFLSWHLALIILVPTAIAVWLAAKRSQSRFDHRLEFTDDTFEPCVLRSPVPVVVHFHQGWHIGNRVMETNLENLARRWIDRLPVGFLDVEDNPRTPASFPDLKLPAITLFYRGELFWVLEGVFYEEDVEDVVDQLEKVEQVDFAETMAETKHSWEPLRRGLR